MDKSRDSNHTLRYTAIRGRRLWKRHVSPDFVEFFNRSGEAISGLFRMTLGLAIFILRLAALALELIKKALENKESEPEAHHQSVQDLD